MGPDLVAELDGLVASHPLRERLWVQFMTALYRSGRQAEALSAYQRARTLLADELGLEPSVELADTHRRILAQDPKLLPAGGSAIATAVLERAAGHAGSELPSGRRFSAAPESEPSRPEPEPSRPEPEPARPEPEPSRPESEPPASEPAEPAAAAAAVDPITADRQAPRPTDAPAWVQLLPVGLRPAATALAPALPCVLVLARALGRGLAVLGRGVVACASVIAGRARAWWGWRSGKSLADMK
jgi:hypothetical protein